MADNRELALVLKLIADQFQSELKKSGGLVGEFQKVISDWKVQLTAAGTALFAIAKSTANYGEELLKTSQKIGIKVEALAGLQHAANLADLSNEQLAQGLKFLSQNMVEAAQRVGDGEALFFRLGVAATDAQGKIRPTEDVLLDLADVFAKSADGAGKTGAAVKLFGKAGIELIPFLNQGKAGIQELMAEAQRLGLVMSKEDAEAANKFNDEIKKLNASMQGLKLKMGQELIPSFTQLMEAMKNLVSGPVGSLFKLEIQGLAAIFTLLNHAIRETSAELETFFAKRGKSDFVKKFYDDALVQGRKDLDAETAQKLRQIFEMPGGKSPASGGGSEQGGAKGTINLKDQTVLGKQLLELFLAQNRAIDIGFDLEAKRQAENRQGMEETAAGQKRIEDAENRIKGIKQQNVFQEIMIGRRRAEQERNDLAENLAAWRDYGEQVGASQEFLLNHELDLVRANLSKRIELDAQTAGALLIAWQNHDDELAKSILDRTTLTEQQRETLMLQTLARYDAASKKYSDDFFAGWAEGMKRYVKDTQSGFGLAADMARRAFQTVEQSAQRFFFDAMEGRITRLKDVMQSFLNFAKQIASQLAGQYITRSIASALFNGGGGGGYQRPELDFNPDTLPKFATGGSFRVPGSGGTDSVPVGFWATPGETVDVRTPGQQGGGVTVVVNNYGQNDVQTSAQRGSDGRQTIYVTVRDMVQGMIQGGDLDPSMGRRFGLSPSPGRR